MNSGDNVARLSYWQEFQHNWQSLLAATIGLSIGMSLNAYVTSIFGPYLIEEFSWTKAQFALLGALSLITLVMMPIIGRLTDLFGVRLVASIGIIGYPLSLLAFSMMTGDIYTFYLLILLQAIFCLTTTTGVYSRIVAKDYTRARGLALAICASGPAVVGAIASPLLTTINDEQGWRLGYQLLAMCSAALGVLTWLLLPRYQQEKGNDSEERSTKKDYARIVKNPAFFILLLGAVLCSFPHALSNSQIKVMLLEHDISSIQAGFMVSFFAAGVLLGRFGAGIALDYFPTHIASAIFMGLPCIGLFILATPTTTYWLIAMAVIFIGLSFGGEADILAYTTAKYFSIDVYSSVMGLLLASVGVAIGLGSLMLSLLLSLYDSFQVFMIGAGLLVIVGSLNFLRLAQVPR